MIDPTLFLQIDLSIPLKLSPKVFINREDENYFVVGLYDRKDARKFLTHFLTVIYSFCDYAVPEELSMMWPPETINDFLKVVINLKKDKVLLTKEEYETTIEKLTSKFSEEEKQFSDDKAWLEPHLKAVKTIPEGSYVLNYGAKGAGCLALEAAKNNPARVVATSENLQNALLARKKAKDQDLSNVDFVSCKPGNISPICYAEKFNVLLTELYCAGIFEERILESVLFAKKNLLTPDCLFIPSKMSLKMFAYDSPLHRDMVQESKEFSILYDLKFGAFTKAMSKHIMGIYTRITDKEITRLSEDYTVKLFDFSTLQKDTFDETFEIEFTNVGKMTGLCAYFELQLTEDIKISNSPFDEKNRYMQRVFTPAASIYPEVGDKIKIRAFYDGTFRVLLVD